MHYVGYSGGDSDRGLLTKYTVKVLNFISGSVAPIRLRLSTCTCMFIPQGGRSPDGSSLFYAGDEQKKCVCVLCFEIVWDADILHMCLVEVNKWTFSTPIIPLRSEWCNSSSQISTESNSVSFIKNLWTQIFVSLIEYSRGKIKSSWFEKSNSRDGWGDHGARKPQVGQTYSIEFFTKSS